MRRSSRATAGVMFALMGLVSSASAQTASPPASLPSAQDSLVASWQIDRVSVAGGGSGLSVDWIRTTPGGQVITAGAGSFSIGDSRWALGRFGGAIRPLERLTLAGQTSLGTGNVAGEPFQHRTLRGDLAVRLTSPVSVTAGDEYIHVAQSRGHVLRVGTTVRASKVVTLDVSQAASAGGNLNTTFSVGRVDMHTTPVSAFGGGAYGTVTPDVVALTGTSARGSQHLHEGFAGLALAMRRATVRVTFDAMSLASVTRRTLTLTTALGVGR